MVLFPYRRLYQFSARNIKKNYKCSALYFFKSKTKYWSEKHIVKYKWCTIILILNISSMFPLLLHTIRPKMNILILRRVKPHINVILMNNYVRCSKMEYGVHNFVRKSCNCSFISPMKIFENLRTYHILSEASTNSLKKTWLVFMVK